MGDLVRVRVNGYDTNVGRAFAEKHELEVLDEPTHRPDGRPRRLSRADGRPMKRRTTVDAEASRKKASRRKAGKKAEAPVAEEPTTEAADVPAEESADQ